MSTAWQTLLPFSLWLSIIILFVCLMHHKFRRKTGSEWIPGPIDGESKCGNVCLRRITTGKWCRGGVGEGLLFKDRFCFPSFQISILKNVCGLQPSYSCRRLAVYSWWVLAYTWISLLANQFIRTIRIRRCILIPMLNWLHVWRSASVCRSSWLT